MKIRAGNNYYICLHYKFYCAYYVNKSKLVCKLLYLEKAKYEMDRYVYSQCIKQIELHTLISKIESPTKFDSLHKCYTNGRI